MITSNTPETEAAVIASGGDWSPVLRETCRRLERERNEANQKLKIATEQWELCIHLAKKNEQERDEARQQIDDYRERHDLLPISWEL